MNIPQDAGICTLIAILHAGICTLSPEEKSCIATVGTLEVCCSIEGAQKLVHSMQSREDTGGRQNT